MTMDALAELIAAAKEAVRAMEGATGSWCEFCGGPDLEGPARALDSALLTYERLKEVAPCGQ